MGALRFSVITAATAAWALASWLVLSTGPSLPPIDGSRGTATAAAERLVPATASEPRAESHPPCR
jgi:hypothetical protein